MNQPQQITPRLKINTRLELALGLLLILLNPILSLIISILITDRLAKIDKNARTSDDKDDLTFAIIAVVISAIATVVHVIMIIQSAVNGTLLQLPSSETTST